VRDLYKSLRTQYARFSRRVQRKVCLVVHGQNGSAVRKHLGHPFAASHVMRHVLNQAMSKIGVSKGAPFTRVKRSGPGRTRASEDSDSRLVQKVLALVLVHKLVPISACHGLVLLYVCLVLHPACLSVAPRSGARISESVSSLAEGSNQRHQGKQNHDGKGAHRRGTLPVYKGLKRYRRTGERGKEKNGPKKKSDNSREQIVGGGESTHSGAPFILLSCNPWISPFSRTPRKNGGGPGGG